MSNSVSSIALASQNKQTDTTAQKESTSNKFIGEDGKVYTESDFVNALENKQVIIQNCGMYQTKSTAIGALAPFVGSSIFVPRIGQVIVGAAGLIVEGVVIFKAGSWAWNTAKNFLLMKIIGLQIKLSQRKEKEVFEENFQENI